MLTIDVRHPDVLEFINAKKDRTKITGANISVMLRDDFMEAVEQNSKYILRFPCNASVEDSTSHKIVEAKDIYNAVVENAWENAEPGQMFIDKHHEYSPDSVYEQYRGITTNP